MATHEEMVKLPYSEDLTEAGVAHLLQVLRQQGGHGSYGDFDAMRQHVAEKAVMLAFRRYLDAQEVPYSLSLPKIFQQELEPEFLLGGRRTTLNVTLVSDRYSIGQARKESQRLTSLPAFVPRDIDQTNQNNEDIYIFAALFGLVTRSQESLQKAIAAGQRVQMLYPFPADWRQPNHWQPFNELIVKTDSEETLDLKLVGLNGAREPLETSVSARPRQREQINEDYHALHYLSTAQVPTAPVGVHNGALEKTEIATQFQWGNLWVYGMEVHVLGYLTAGEYHRQARFVPVGSKRFGVPDTKQAYWNVSAYHLRSMADLASRVQRWKAGDE